MRKHRRFSQSAGGPTPVPSGEENRPVTEGVPLASIIPRRFGDQPSLMVLRSPHDPVAERYRKLRSRLETLEIDGDGNVPRAILLTSALPDEGKTTTAINLGFAFSEDQDRSTVLVDLDMRRPSLAKYLVPEPVLGVSEVLSKGVGLEHALIATKDSRLTILPAGKATSNPTAILRSEALSSLIGQLRERFHWVVIDSPPCVPFADASAIQAFVDGTILVVRARNTAKATVNRALEAIDAGLFLGVVLTDVQQTVVDKYYYRYDAYDPYRYSESDEETKG